MDFPTQVHFQVANRVLRYVKGTSDFGTFYNKRGEEELVAYMNNDYVGDCWDFGRDERREEKLKQKNYLICHTNINVIDLK